MEVILRQRVEKLGQMGDIVRVKPGFARNFLIPQGIAVQATQERISEFESQRVQLEAHNLKLKKEAESMADRMKGVSVILVRQAGENGHLYGSVRPQDIASSLQEQGYTLKHTQVKLSTTIKDLGLYEARIELHPEVSLLIRVNVALSEEEAKVQEQRALAPQMAQEPEEALSEKKAREASRKAKEKALEEERLVKEESKETHALQTSDV